ncbi:MAG: class I SAM-dependent methyltransferase [Acidimicrobiales bacterium]
MTPVDRLLQTLRFRQAARWIPDGSRVLEVGCAEGELFDHLGRRIAPSVGIDPLLDRPRDHGRHRLLPGCFPVDVPVDLDPFDVVAMLATLEHFPPSELAKTALETARLTKPGGRLVVTVPAPVVDVILEALLALRLIHGQETDQHHGQAPQETPFIFGDGFELVHASRFELGLNHLFVLRRR